MNFLTLQHENIGYVKKEHLMSAHVSHLRQLCCMLTDQPIQAASALITQGNQTLARTFSTVTENCDPTAHAGINAIRQAAKKLNTRHLNDCTLYLSHEPCLMCYQAAKSAMIANIYFVLADKTFGVFTQHHHLALEKSHHHTLTGHGPYESLASTTSNRDLL